MAVQPYTIEFEAPGVRTVRWVLRNGDSGRPIPCWMYTDNTAQVYGEFGVGGAIQIQGSNDQANNGAHFSQLRTTDRILLEFTEDDLEQILEHPYLVRPLCPAGDGDTELTVIMCMSTTRG